MTDLTQEYDNAIRGQAALRMARLGQVRSKKLHQLKVAPDHPKAPRWRERVTEIEGLMATIRKHGRERPSERPVGVLIGAPSLGRAR